MSTPQKIYVIDVEATCWEKQYPDTRNEIIEIGITPIDLKTRQLEESESILVKPVTTEISAFCTKLTTLTPEYVAEHGVEFPVAMAHLEKTCKLKKNIFASWGDYDRKAFERNCNWNRVSNPVGNMTLNVKALFAAKHGYTGGIDKCAADVGLTFEGTHHRGVDDSRMIAKVLLTLL